MSVPNCRLALVRQAFVLGFLAVATMPAAAQENAVQEDEVVATVDGTPITEAELALAESDLDPQFSQLPPEQRRAAALSAIIEIKLLASEAEQTGLGEDADFKRRMDFLRQRALHSAYVEKEVANRVTDEAVRSRYDQEIANAPPTNEVRARHILVKTKEEAEEIIEHLDEGAEFEQVAKERSSDPGSGAQGGDLGYFGPGRMVPEFEEAAFALEVGAHSQEPVETQFGFHVLKVEDKRSQQPPAFEQVKEQIRSLLLRENYVEVAKNLRDSAEIEIQDPTLEGAVEQLEQAQ
jgi:peptidyl-prolyl cis-trans isomerase C